MNIKEEYLKEIKEIWKEIETSLFYLCQNSPKSYKTGLNILEKCLENSEKNVIMLEKIDPFEKIDDKNFFKRKEIEFVKKGEELDKLLDEMF